MANRVHAELAENERPFLGQVLQTQQILFELVLIVQINVEAEKIDILREEIFGRRISRVRKERVGIDRAADADQFLHELRDAAHAEPAHHRARDFVADQVTEDRGMTDIRLHRIA